MGCFVCVCVHKSTISLSSTATIECDPPFLLFCQCQPVRLTSFLYLVAADACVSLSCVSIHMCVFRYSKIFFVGDFLMRMAFQLLLKNTKKILMERFVYFFVDGVVAE